jgi:type III secretory pathway lipoprotein EscJ
MTKRRSFWLVAACGIVVLLAITVLQLSDPEKDDDFHSVRNLKMALAELGKSNYQKGFDLILEGIVDGYFELQIYSGIYFYYSLLDDKAGAAKWIINVADQGWAPAQRMAGLIYEKGLDVEVPDGQKAIIWYLKAANQGDRPAQGRIEYLLKTGRGYLPESYKESKGEIYSVLYSGISQSDRELITSALEKNNIPYQYLESNVAINVPAEKIYETRMQLALKNLPMASPVWFGPTEFIRRGVSEFNKKVMNDRGIEHEIAHAVQTLAPVSKARVHIATPINESQKDTAPKLSAGLMLELKPGQQLSKDQVRGIQYLVSVSIPNLKPGDVALINQDGHVISPKVDHPIKTLKIKKRHKSALTEPVVKPK